MPLSGMGEEAGFEYIFYLSLSLTFCSTWRETVNVCCVAVRLLHYYSRLTCFTSWKHQEPYFSLLASFQHRYENPDISFSLNSKQKYRNRCRFPQSCIVASIIRICPNCNIYLHSAPVVYFHYILADGIQNKCNGARLCNCRVRSEDWNLVCQLLPLFYYICRPGSILGSTRQINASWQEYSFPLQQGYLLGGVSFTDDMLGLCSGQKSGCKHSSSPQHNW